MRKTDEMIGKSNMNSREELNEAPCVAIERKRIRVQFLGL